MGWSHTQCGREIRTDVSAAEAQFRVPVPGREVPRTTGWENQQRAQPSERGCWSAGRSSKVHAWTDRWRTEQKPEKLRNTREELNCRHQDKSAGRDQCSFAEPSPFMQAGTISDLHHPSPWQVPETQPHPTCGTTQATTSAISIQMAYLGLSRPI